MLSCILYYFVATCAATFASFPPPTRYMMLAVLVNGYVQIFTNGPLPDNMVVMIWHRFECVKFAGISPEQYIVVTIEI